MKGEHSQPDTIIDRVLRVLFEMAPIDEHLCPCCGREPVLLAGDLCGPCRVDFRCEYQERVNHGA